MIVEHDDGDHIVVWICNWYYDVKNLTVAMCNAEFRNYVDLIEWFCNVFIVFKFDFIFLFLGMVFGEEIWSAAEI
jgi:hypothetical protein